MAKHKFLWSVPQHISVSLSACIFAVFSPTMPSLSILRRCFFPVINILALSCYITQGINHRLPWRWNHPCRCMCQLDASSVGMFVCLLYTRLYLLFLPPVRAVRPSRVMRLLLHSEWLWQLSRRDALTCHTRLPLSSVQNNDWIQRHKKKMHTVLSGLFGFFSVKETLCVKVICWKSSKMLPGLE